MLLEVLSAIKDSFKVAMPKLRRVELHSGDFNAAEVARQGNHAPGLFVSLAGTDVDIESGYGPSDRPLQLMIYIITRDEPRLDRFQAVVNLVEAAIEHIKDNHWGLEYALEPTQIASKNLFTGDIERQKLCLWAVRWTQCFRVGESLFDASGVLPKHFYLGIDPDTGPANIDKYIEVTNGL